MEIGGDFYDVVELGGGRVALVIGDVQGHNLFAASLIPDSCGRPFMRETHAQGHGPAEVMARANQRLVDLNTDPDKALFATCCYVVLRPATANWPCAGQATHRRCLSPRARLHASWTATAACRLASTRARTTSP